MLDTPADVETAPILRTPILDILCEWLLYVSAALIVGGLLMDSVHRPGMLGGSSYNIMGVLSAMWEANEYLVAVIVSASGRCWMSFWWHF